MPKQKSYYSYEPRAVDIIDSLLSEYQWMTFLKGRNKPYEKLLDALISTGIKKKTRNNYNSRETQITKIAEDLNESVVRIRKWLFAIYNDIFLINESEPELFNNGGAFRYELSFETMYGNYSYFNLWSFIEIDKSDSFRFPFIKGKLHESFFFPESVLIVHEFGEITISIKFQQGTNNRYRDLILDKAIFLEDSTNWYYSEYLDRFSDFEDRLKKYARQKYTGI